MLYVFRPIDTYKKVHHEQFAIIPEYKSTPTCCGYCP